MLSISCLHTRTDQQISACELKEKKKDTVRLAFLFLSLFGNDSVKEDAPQVYMQHLYDVTTNSILKCFLNTMQDQSP